MTTDTVPVLRPLDAQDLRVWRLYWGDLTHWLRPIFARSDRLACAIDYLAGLLSPAERKTTWQLAEQLGEATPYRFQHLLGRATWDPDALRDRLAAYVTTYLATNAAIGVLDETGFLKKGTHSVAVARQYSGTAGHVANCQVGVFLAYTSARGHTLLDRALYLPEEWVADTTRRTATGVPPTHAFATKPALALTMLQRAAAAQISFAWVTADSVYGADRPLRHWLEAQHQAYVLGITGNEQLWVGHRARAVSDLIAQIPPTGWEEHTTGMGSQGPRVYAWYRVALNPTDVAGWQHWVVFRRSLSDPHDVHAYRAFGPAQTSLARLAEVAGTRWAVETSIQTAKGEVGLDQYEVRSWTGWHRHITLAMWAQALLAVIRADQGAVVTPPPKKTVQPTPSSLTTFKARRGLHGG
jgi:SRSO17 transposase